MPRIIAGGDMDLARSLAPRLREADRLEVFRSTGMTPLEGLEWALDKTRNGFWVEHEGEVVAMGGCSPIPSDPLVGCPWMLASDFITKNRQWFLRNTPALWAAVSFGYQYLWNLVDAQNTVHVRWLQWSGCTFIGRRELNGNPFIEFAKCVNP